MPASSRKSSLSRFRVSRRRFEFTLTNIGARNYRESQASGRQISSGEHAARREREREREEKKRRPELSSISLIRAVKWNVTTFLPPRVSLFSSLFPRFCNTLANDLSRPRISQFSETPGIVTSYRINAKARQTRVSRRGIVLKIYRIDASGTANFEVRRSRNDDRYERVTVAARAYLSRRDKSKRRLSRAVFHGIYAASRNEPIPVTTVTRDKSIARAVRITRWLATLLTPCPTIISLDFGERWLKLWLIASCEV